MIAAEFEDVGAVEDGGGFLVNLLAGLEDLEEDGFEATTRFRGFAFCELVYMISESAFFLVSRADAVGTFRRVMQCDQWGQKC